MNTLVTTIITTLIAGLTSGGFLGFILKIVQRKDTSSQMLLGLGHHEILYPLLTWRNNILTKLHINLQMS